jgi:pantoate--beta-alanine ligase
LSVTTAGRGAIFWGMRTIQGVKEMQEAVAAVKRTGRRLALVPTMGALHAGHEALIHKAREKGAAVIVSIYVNPTQFGESDDYKKYPRSLEADAAVCRRLEVDVVFAPSDEQMYPGGLPWRGTGGSAWDSSQASSDHRSSTWVEEAALARSLEGVKRPGHFRGVCTVVAKLFNIAQPDAAVFGQKDYQQLKVVERMTRDLCYPIEIVAVPTVREPDGLAMSSRNQLLSAEERAQATVLHKGLKFAQDLFNSGERNAHRLEAGIMRAVELAPAARLDYAEIADAATLEPAFEAKRGDVALVAAYVGKTRLIDSLLL